MVSFKTCFFAGDVGAKTQFVDATLETSCGCIGPNLGQGLWGPRFLLIFWGPFGALPNPAGPKVFGWGSEVAKFPKQFSVR